MSAETPAVAEQVSAWAAGIDSEDIPAGLRQTLGLGLLDFAGLCIAARRAPYLLAARDGWDADGTCTVLGHTTPLDAAGAAFVNGTAAHGEDYDDTFEGTPVHTGAVILPAVLAACERFGGSGEDVLRGAAAGGELACRLALVAPTAIHRAGFHPTAVIGALAAALGVGTALRLSAAQLTDALGVAGSFASGIIEYLAEGTWTKRLHAGWAAQSGLRAALVARQGFRGPRTVFEGTHGFFHGFADHSIEPRYAEITDGLGEDWRVEQIAFKPYACGTMAQPFVDCAIRLAAGNLAAEDIERIVCKVGEGTVHRLWEPLAEKRAPSSSYSAKFSVPYCIAVGFLDGAAGLEQFAEASTARDDVRALAARVEYVIDPDDEYPRNYTGHLQVTLRDGSVREARQPHLRGGVREPLTRAEILAKFHANAAFGGWPDTLAQRLADYCAGLFASASLDGLAAFRR
ncbi:MAG: MmgE/PrpD family protein [Gammaproteobacteria bacterium]|nr:MmgE/PrpD family protein [Gammaproteobacteria bacterium]